MRFRDPRVGVVSFLLALLAGCSEKRWACEACVDGDKTTCAPSSTSGPTPHRDEEHARCSAGEELCSTLTGPSFDRLCRGKGTSVMFGCSKEFLSQFRFTCSSKSHLNIPLLIDL